jgi:hypothetical protein
MKREAEKDGGAYAPRALLDALGIAFEEVARGWLLLAEQMEWIDRQRSTLRDEEHDRSSC